MNCITLLSPRDASAADQSRTLKIINLKSDILIVPARTCVQEPASVVLPTHSCNSLHLCSLAHLTRSFPLAEPGDRKKKQNMGKVNWKITVLPELKGKVAGVVSLDLKKAMKVS